MLVAMTAFVLHGAPLAWQLPSGGAKPCHGAAHESAASAQHVHLEASAGDQHHHASSHAVEDHAGDTAQAHPDGDSGLCCGNVCAVAITVPHPEGAGLTLSVARTLLPAGSTADGIDPNGLRRPPRTPFIA
jgi:hypothetical protein